MRSDNPSMNAADSFALPQRLPLASAAVSTDSRTGEDEALPSPSARPRKKSASRSCAPGDCCSPKVRGDVAASRELWLMSARSFTPQIPSVEKRTVCKNAPLAAIYGTTSLNVKQDRGRVYDRSVWLRVQALQVLNAYAPTKVQTFSGAMPSRNDGVSDGWRLASAFAGNSPPASTRLCTWL